MIRYTILLALALAAGATAQLKEDDILLGSISSGQQGGCFYLDWSTGKLGTLRSGFECHDVATDHANTAVMACSPPPGTNEIYLITRSGQTTTIFPNPPGLAPLALAYDQDRKFIGVCSNGNVHKYQVAWRPYSVSTLITGLGALNGITRNEDTGIFMATRFTDNAILFLDGQQGYFGTFTTLGGSSQLTMIDYVPSTGDLVVGRVNSTKGVAFVTQAGTIAHEVPIATVNAVTVDEVRNRIFVATTSGQITELTPAGTPVRTLGFTGYNWAGLDIFGDMAVTCYRTTGAPHEFKVHLQFTASPFKNYLVALAVNNRPGIPLGHGRRLNLQFDPMFLATVGGNLPYFTVNFAGVLDSTGSNSSQTRFSVPAYLPNYGVVWVGAVAVNPAALGGLEVGNTQAVRP